MPDGRAGSLANSWMEPPMFTTMGRPFRRRPVERILPSGSGSTSDANHEGTVTWKNQKWPISVAQASRSSWSEKAKQQTSIEKPARQSQFGDRAPQSNSRFPRSARRLTDVGLQNLKVFPYTIPYRKCLQCCPNGHFQDNCSPFER